MAVFDTHRAYTAFREAGFSDAQAQALIDQSREGSDTLATRADLDVLQAANKADLDKLRTATRADLEKFRAANEADLEKFRAANEADLRELELRLRHDLTLRLGTLVFASAGLQVVIIGILLALFRA